MQNTHEIDFKIYGEEMQYVEIELDPYETVIAEAGSFMMMDSEIKMATIFGDGSERDHGKGLMGKLKGAGKRLISGEGLFMTVFTNKSSGKAHAAFAAPYPGKIIATDLDEHGGVLICQKDAFLCAAKGVSIDLHLQKKLGAGFLGGEGFILQQLEGDGKAFVHAGGTVIERTLNDEVLRVDTGCIVGFEPSIEYSIEQAGGLRSMVFGGEGNFIRL